MKLLHVGLSAGHTVSGGLQKAFSALYECEEIGFNTPDINEVIRQKTGSFRPDMVWMQIQTPDIISPETVSYLKDKGIFVMNWMGDIRNEFPDWTAQLGASLTCFSNMNYVHVLKSRGIKSEYLQIGYDQSIYTPNGMKADSAEIVFFGNNYGNEFPLSELRWDMVNKLKSIYGRRFGVYGRGWESSDGDYMNDPKGEAAIYRGAKIAINLSHFDYSRCSSSRLYKILGCGTFCLTKRFPEMEDDFEEDIELVAWDTMEDLIDEIEFWLANEGIRKAVAECGNEVALKKFTYEKMVENIHQLYLQYK